METIRQGVGPLVINRPTSQQPLTIGLIGASGFIGRHLLDSLLPLPCEIRQLCRSATSAPSADGTRHYIGNLNTPDSLQAFLTGTDVLINLAWSTAAEESPHDHARQLASACIENGVRRLIHVSTAMVLGRSDRSEANEDTPPNPLSRYEKSKLVVEQELAATLGSRVDLAILRPTAVFGPDSRNLEQLARRMLDWPLWTRAVLRFVYGNRNMHLVPVETVVQAVELLAFHPKPLLGQVFIVAEDAHPSNHYQRVDELLAASMDAPKLRSTLSIPSSVLHALLRLSRRSQDDPRLQIIGTRLASLGFAPKKDFEQAVREYGRWYALQRKGNS
ncbi:NAD-dependent epimerase/dehydratase family protein [Pseudomonas sp. UBA6310]|uniref:NAD-dependent epimerase/dehydratase family protein n=1 Tax=Pseudomonas sp. UBA6310 TaxID=1947327 RepID=UPI00257B77AC|nr:NAD(P)-dependent oxidoreductase [Pseudomonas sp. UBA6310]